MRDPGASFIVCTRLVLLGALLWFTGQAAQAAGSTISPTGGMALSFGQGSATMGDGADFSRLLGKTWTPGTGTSGGSLAERYLLNIGGASIEAQAARAVTLGEIAMATALLGGAAYGGWQVGSKIAEALELGPNSPGNTACAVQTGNWLCDPTAPPAEESGYVYTAGGNSFPADKLGTGATAGSACSSAASKNSGTVSSSGGGTTTTNVTTYNVVQASDPPMTCVLSLDVQTTICTEAGCNTYQGAHNDGFDSGLTKALSTTYKCPASIDALNPAWSVPEGAPPDGPNGKCRTGRYNPASAADVAERIISEGEPGKIRDAFPEVQAGGQPIPVADERHLTGPSSKPLPSTTTTTTTPAGTTTTTNNSTVNYTYNNSSVSYTITNNSTTTNPDGTTTSTSDDKIPDPCLEHPERVGCRDLGDPATTNPQWEEKEVTFAPEDLGFGGSCPAPLVVPFYRGGNNVTMSFQPICDLGPMFRAFILACTAVACGMLIVRQCTA